MPDTNSIKSNGRTYTKIAEWQTTPTQDTKPKRLVAEVGLTVFLGGAGMIGDYNQDMIAALHQAGIKNAAYGNYSSLPRELEQHLPGFVDMLGDAANVVFYNQADTDPIAFEYDKDFTIDLPLLDPWKPIKIRVPQDMARAQKMDFSLAKLEISQSLPKAGQFNLIGYSWGSVIAARAAVYYARKGQTINHLVLIAAPINKSLLDAAASHANIKNTIIIDLSRHGDPIYAGITDKEIVDAAPQLALQMKKGDGHFYYSGSDDNGKARRIQLATMLFGKGLR